MPLFTLNLYRFIFQALYIDSCKYSFVMDDDALQGLSLTRLSINNCFLHKPPALTSSKKSLISLNLHDNFITYIPERYFDGCMKLKDLQLGYNYLNRIPNLEAVSQTLNSISLVDNYLMHLNTSWITTFMPKLISIELQINVLHSFCMPQRELLPNLVNLNLSYNILSSFYLPPWDGLHVSLMNNSIRCDATMSWVKRCTKGVPLGVQGLNCGENSIVEQLTCHSPKDVNGLNPLDTGNIPRTPRECSVPPPPPPEPELTGLPLWTPPHCDMAGCR